MGNLSPHRQSTACENMNHRRANPPVGFCPQCGGVVNSNLPVKQCADARHAQARRQQAVYCVDCGAQLIKS